MMYLDEEFVWYYNNNYFLKYFLFNNIFIFKILFLI